MKTKKAPAFQFYASDFYMDTIAWTDEMVGLHIRLLCQQWTNGKIESDENYPVHLTEKQKKNFDKIRGKYEEKNGFFFNKKLMKVKQKRDEFIKKAIKTGTEGALARWGKDGKPYTKPHSENIALQSSSSSSIISKQEVVSGLKSCGVNQNILESEAEKLMKHYANKPIKNLNAICNTWATHLIGSAIMPGQVKEMIL